MIRNARWLTVLGILLAAAVARGDDWTQFRGPDGQGHSPAKNVPLTWSESENIAWKTAIPGLGWSSPVVAGQQIWLTTGLDGGHSLRALAIDRASGKVLHDVEVFQLESPGSIHSLNSHASPTSVIDGQRVFVHYGAHGTACLSTDGQVIWRNQELKYNHVHGPGGSPVVWKDLLFVNCDGGDVQFVVALDKATGSIRWKRPRQHTSEARKTGKSEVPMAYCTPLLLDLEGKTQLVSLGSDAVVAHEPATGEELWWFSFNGYSNVSRPVYGKGKLYFSSGFGVPEFFAARIPGQGDLTESNKVWSFKSAPLVPRDVSPILVGDELYTISDSGVALCFDAETGQRHWQERLGSKFWASPVLADGRLYCLDEQATTTVLAPGKQFKVLATNKLEGQTQASPAILDGVIFLRTDTHLYRIEKT